MFKCWYVCLSVRGHFWIFLCFVSFCGMLWYIMICYAILWYWLISSADLTWSSWSDQLNPLVELKLLFWQFLTILTLVRQFLTILHILIIFDIFSIFWQLWYFAHNGANDKFNYNIVERSTVSKDRLTGPIGKLGRK